MARVKTVDGWTVYGPPPDEVLTNRVAVALEGFVHDCRLFARVAREAKLKELPEALHLSWEEFCQQRLKHSPSVVEAILAGLDVIGEELPVPAHVAERVGRALGKRGGDHGNQYTGGKRQHAGGRMPYGSNNVTYLLARLDRDHPALAASVRAGEVTTRAAARSAGIVKTRTTLDQLFHWWTKATPEERARFLEVIRGS